MCSGILSNKKIVHARQIRNEYEIVFSIHQNLPVKYLKLLILILFFNSNNLHLTYSQSISFNHLSTANGLSNNSVNDIIQDRTGFLWLATDDGLNRFDGYEFRIFRNNPSDSNSLSDNLIQTLIEDSQGNLWIGTRRGWLNKYEPIHEKFSRWKIPSDIIEENIINSLCIDSKERVWIGTYKSGLYLFDPFLGEIRNWINIPGDSTSLSNNYISSVVEDDYGNIWIGTYFGLNKFNPENEKAGFKRFFRYKLDRKRVSDDIYWSLTKSKFDKNYIWIGTANGLLRYNIKTNQYDEYIFPNHENLQFGTSAGTVIEEMIDNEIIIWTNSYAGLVRLNTEGKQIQRFIADKYNLNSLQSNELHNIIKDRSGVFWLATNNGLSYFTVKSLKFNYTFYEQNKFSDVNIIRKENIKAITKTSDGKLWFGTDRVIFHTVNDGNHFTIKQLATRQNINVWSLCSGNKNDLWIGTYGSGLFHLDLLTNTLRQVSLFESGFYPESIKFIKAVCLDKKSKNLLLGFWGYGLAVYNPDTKSIKTYFRDPGNENSLSYEDVWTIFQDSKDRIWIGTNGGGLNLFDINNNKFYRWTANDSTSLNGNSVYSICESNTNKKSDQEKFKSDITTLWIGTNNGLNKFEIINSRIKSYSDLEVYITGFTEKDGLADNSVKSVVEDNEGNLWLGTSSGISFFNVENQNFSNFNISDGLTGTDFNFSSVYKDENGVLYFGSNEGLNLFDPQKITLTKFIPPIVITDFQILNKSVEIGEKSELTKSILYTKEVQLSHSQNVFSFQFAALDYSAPHNIQYAYQMENFDKDWINAGNRRHVTYTNLNPGEYIFKVKSTNSDGIWSEDFTSIKVIITPPWWQTFWAIGLYILVFILGVWGIIKFQNNRTRLRHELKMREFESHHLREIESMKSRFFANLSHEFRTPLMLIKGPLEQLLSGRIKENKTEYYRMALRNTEKLQHLIDELLELSQLELDKIPLNLEKHNLVVLLQTIASAFNPLAEEKNIAYNFNSSLSELSVNCDKDKFEKIINNLLSNAFKFTESGGVISVNMEAEQSEEKQFAVIKISDNGIGIPETHQEKIFDRFYQVEDSSSKTYPGSGIGLALVKELVLLHQWNISVSSKPGESTTFTLTIPLTKEEYNSIDYIEEEKPETNIELHQFSDGYLENDLLNDENEKPDSDKPTILFVEDSEDVRMFVSGLLKSDFNMLVCDNALSGIEISVSEIPDLIISDVMMPEMDGIEFCHQIKTNHLTSHIPVILLTAKATEESKIEGLETGADDYLTKPFNYDELLIRIKNLINQRKILKEKFSKEINLHPEGLTKNSLDKEFIRKAYNLVKKNIGNSNYDTEELAEDMFLSRRQLHRKILTLTGHGPGEFIRTVRLKQAALMIVENRLSITQIAYEVGFNSPAQFTRAFKKQFNCLPSEFGSNYKKESAI